MSEAETLFAVVPIGGTRVLIAAERVHAVGPASDAVASELRCVDVARRLEVPVTEERHALRLEVRGAATWLLVDPGTRFTRIAHAALRPLPEWIAQDALRAVAPIDATRFAFELDLEVLLGEGPT